MPVPDKIIRDVDAEARAEWTYATDDELHGVSERWSLPVDGREDCDGWMRGTAILKLLRRGVAPEDIAYLEARLPRGEGHAVCLVKSEGRGWVNCGDTRTRNSVGVGLLQLAGWELVKYMRLSEPGVWREWA